MNLPDTLKSLSEGERRPYLIPDSCQPSTRTKIEPKLIGILATALGIWTQNFASCCDCAHEVEVA